MRGDHPVSDPISTFIEVASILDLDSLVAVGDHLVLDPRILDPYDIRPHIQLLALRAGVHAGSGRGVRAARIAAALVRGGVESPMETRLRLLLGHAGFPEPTCGYELIDDGRTVGWFDLAWPEWKVIAEYDGDQHRQSTEQYEKDIARFDRADELGWKVVRVRRRGVLESPDSTAARVLSALSSRGWV